RHAPALCTDSRTTGGASGRLVDVAPEEGQVEEEPEGCRVAGHDQGRVWHGYARAEQVGQGSHVRPGLLHQFRAELRSQVTRGRARRRVKVRREEVLRQRVPGVPEPKRLEDGIDAVEWLQLRDGAEQAV